LNNSEFRLNFWVDINTLEDAIKASKTAMVAAYICATITAALVFAGLFLGHPVLTGFGPWALLDAALFVGLGFGISNYSRLCAALALGLYLFEQATSAMTFRTYIALLACLFIVMFIKGVRGTLAYHRLNKP
jgi:hypothetical protein